MDASGQRTLTKWILGCCILAIATLFAYRGVLFVGSDTTLYPWANDTLGHVTKSAYLLDAISNGVWTPELFPGWYLGHRLFRYYAPLPYYLLSGLTALVDDPIAAANWFIALCAYVGGVGWLLYHRRLGWSGAIAGGILFLFLPDNLRVAFAEGNLPRVLATAFLPLVIFLLLRSLEEPHAGRYRLGLAGVFAVTVLSHAMMAAIFAACCTMVALLGYFGTRATTGRVLRTIVALGCGILLAGWWLLPSLHGGITGLDAAAVAAALGVVPLEQLVDPFSRFRNPEAIYVGIAVPALAIAGLFIRRGRSRQTVALTVTALVSTLVAVPGFNSVFTALPFHHLFWPIRFLGVASTLFLLALLWQLRGWQRHSASVGILLVALIAIDHAGSLPLIHVRPPPGDLVDASVRLGTVNGWREATLDYSRFGSVAPYVIATAGNREQLYGWAYQGARTARNVAALNEGMQNGFAAYVLDRLMLFGVDDVVVQRGAPGAAETQAALQVAGFERAYAGERALLYHRDGGPRAYRADWPAIGIGHGAWNFAYLFPQLIVGSSPRIDDYSVEELRRFRTVVLSGFRWKDKQTAERLVDEVAAAGVDVVVDLTGVPDDPLARIPRFFGVWGERIVLPPEALGISTTAGNELDLAFDEHPSLWYTHTPQGTDVTTVQFKYLGETATAVGYNRVGDGRVWFIGLNLPYHALRTQDPAATRLLEEILQVPPATPSKYSAVPLGEYVADDNGYRFTYSLSRPERLLVPVAHHDGTVVTIDGREIPTASFENLVAFSAPAGIHTVRITVEQTPIYVAGRLVSGLGIVGLVALVASGYGTRPRETATSAESSRPRGTVGLST